MTQTERTTNEVYDRHLPPSLDRLCYALDHERSFHVGDCVIGDFHNQDGGRLGIIKRIDEARRPGMERMYHVAEGDATRLYCGESNLKLWTGRTFVHADILIKPRWPAWVREGLAWVLAVGCIGSIVGTAFWLFWHFAPKIIGWMVRP